MFGLKRRARVERVASFTMLLGMLAVERDANGAEWCRNNKIRPMIEYLGIERGKIEGNRGASADIERELDEAKTVALTLLRHHCRACGRCELAQL